MARTRDSVRAVDVYDGGEQHPSREPQSQVEITDQTEEEVEILYEPADDYPYPDQVISRGTFEYLREGVLGTSSARGSYQIRLESGMFVVRMNSGSAQLDEVVDALDERLDQELGRTIEIHSDLTDHSYAVWSLLDEATWIGSVEVRHRGERTSLADLREERGVSLEDIRGEYQLIEADFILETPWGDPVNVVFESGKIEVATNSDDTHEYVLQLLEVARAR